MLEINKVWNMDCIEGMKLLPDNSVDSIVTDPPYWLSFMGKKWDYDVPTQAIREECLRVLKPWGYLLAFAGTRTQHRMAVRIEDAWFEIRDMIAWVYGSWFPKSLAIWKAIDKSSGYEWEIIEVKENTRNENNNSIVSSKNDCGWTRRWILKNDMNYVRELSDEAKQWEWRWTALKPALESITLAQKSFDFSSVLDILIKDNLYILRKELCQFPLCVWIAEKHLQLNQQEQEGNVSQSIAEWIAEKNINIQEDLPVVIDILQSLLIENTNWNIVLWWLSILVELYNQTNTYITETKISLTTDLIILNSYEFESIYQSIIQAKDNQTNELTASVYNVELLFKGLQLKLKTIQEHFAQECAISRAGDDDLLPNLSPIIMSRKPLWEKNVAKNALKWWTGGINIDWCRVGISQEDKEMLDAKASTNNNGVNFDVGEGKAKGTETPANNLGRFPANFIHDWSDEVVDLFPETKTNSSTHTPSNSNPRIEERWYRNQKASSWSASRFFYVAKASKSDRNEWCEGLESKFTKKMNDWIWEREHNENESSAYNKNNHPTVKPTDLMRYLTRLVTRKWWLVLDPFTWSWSTWKACKLEWFDFIWFELDEWYCDIANKRLQTTQVWLF